MGLDRRGEVWHDIGTYEGYYQLSTRGRVRSVDRVVPHGHLGTVKLRGCIKPASCCKRDVCHCNKSKGYWLSKDGGQQFLTFEELVALTFGPAE